MRSASDLLIVGLLAVGACRVEPDRAPFEPTNGHDGVVVVAAGDDAGKPDDEDDAGSAIDAATEADASVPFYSCERVEGLRSSGGEDMPQATATTAPADFIVVRQALRWNSDCEKPVLTIELSDGICPAGAGHQLEIALDVNGIEDGLIRLGQNPVAPEAEMPPITVRYQRPSRLSPHGTWGTCDDVTGLIQFTEAPELIAGANLQASYQFTLTPCDAATTGTMDVIGMFKVQLRSALSEVCPSRVQ